MGCPFGIGLRGTLPATIRKDFFEYALEGFPGRLWVHRASNEDAMLPMLFVMESSDGTSAGSPRDHGYPEGLFRHECGATEIERVTIMGPGIEDLPIPACNIPIDRWPDEEWRMDVEVASKVHEQVNVVPPFNLLLRLRGPGIIGPNDPMPRDQGA